MNNKQLNFIVAAIGLSMSLVACSDGPDGGRPTINEINLSRAESQVCEAMSAFGVDMFREVASDKTITDACPNFVVSPVSMATALSMLANATEGNVRSQICDALGCDDIQALNELNRKLMMFLPNPGRKCNIQLENSVWFRPEYTLTQSFKSAMSDYYFAPTVALDFKLQGSENVINSWAARASHGILDRVVEHGEIEDAEALLANVTYFNGKWANDLFDDSFTKKAVFHGINSDATVDMMFGAQDGASVYKTESWTAANIDYEGDVAIALVRPADGVTLSDVSSNFSASDFYKVINSQDKYYVILHLPRFKSTADIEFNKVLGSMGININAFRPDAMFNSCDIEMPIMISHKARLETNEKGTVAAAYTGEIIMIAPGPSNRPFALDFDVPFMYFIYDKSAQTILMAGQFTQP